MLVKKNNKHKEWHYGTGCEKRGGFLPITIASDVGHILSGAKDIYKAASYDPEKESMKLFLNTTQRISRNREKEAEDAVNKMREIVNSSNNTKSGSGIQVY